MDRLQIKSTVFTITCIALITAFVSEIKVIPFENAPFRFGLGSIAFFLSVLITSVPIIWTGIITGLTVVLFRTIIDTLYLQEIFIQSFMEHLPAAFFYVVFANCLRAIPLENLKQKPVILGICAALFEMVANLIEQFFYLLFNIHANISLEAFSLLIAVAFLRSFFVVGIYSVITLQEQKRQLEQLLTIHADLYVEALYLQKSIEQIEALTADSFQLYKQLMPIERSSSLEALRLSQEIHELKKDAVRMHAGLSKIGQTGQTNLYDMATILQYVVATNEKYSIHLQKHIIINVHCDFLLQTNQQLAMLAILNNLVSNAIEAIEKHGVITIAVSIEKDTVVLSVIDNGPGIPKDVLPVIFEPGYTSKFNDDGYASTGIGLSHVKSIVERLQGTIVATSGEVTTFTVTIPIQSII